MRMMVGSWVAGRVGVGRVVAVFAVVSLSVVGGSSAWADHGGSHVPGDPGRAYELVSPPYKVAGVGVGLPVGGGASTQAALAGSGSYVGERFAVSGQLGAILLDAPFATATDWALAERDGGEVGWLSHSPVTHSFQSIENYRMMQLHEASPDLSTMLWVGNAGDLPFFAEMGGLGQASNGSTLISDWGDPPGRLPRWEPIAPLEASQRIGDSIAGLLFTVPAVSDDGSLVAANGRIRGVGGSGDPTLDTIGGSAHSAYVDDISGGLSDSWPGAGVREPAASCTGQDGGPGLDRTRIPVRNGDESLGEAACAPPAGGRSSRLVSDYGSAINTQDDSLGGNGTPTTNVVSGDGSRVFFMAPDPAGAEYPAQTACTADTDAATKCPPQLYVRQRNSDGEVVTRWISRPEAGVLDGPMPAALLGQALFEGASADGSRVFFRTDTPLTADDPNGETQSPANPDPVNARGARSWDLYMFELAPGPDGDRSTPDGDPTGPGSSLTRITAGPAGTSDCSAEPNGGFTNALRFVADDGSRVYFSCAAPLGGVADRATGTVAGTQAGTPTTSDQTNVYLYDSSESNQADRYTFVARIPRATGTSLTTNENLTRCASASGLRGASVLEAKASFAYTPVTCWRGTSDGSFATFWTLGRLTAGDPNEFGAGASADIYAYDAASDELVRVSAPQGTVDDTYACGFSTSATECYADPGMHATNARQGAANPLLNVVDSGGDNRVLFFESESRLVNDDHNDVYDVYKWQDGALSLVSSGAADSDGTTYKGNSADGQNVYLATRDRLTWQDVDAVLDVYTARVGGGIAQPPQPPVCVVLADSCQGAGAVPVAVSPPASELTAADGDAKPGARVRLSIGALGAKQRRKAARSGVIPVVVSTSKAGVVRAKASARIGGKRVGVGSARKRAAKAGKVVLRVRLAERARRVLGQGKALGVSLSVSQSGARSRTATVALERGDR